MNFAAAFDIFVLLMTLFFVIKGGFRGFVGEILSLVGILGGVYAALRLSGGAEALLLRLIPSLSPTMASIVAMASMFVAVTLVCSLIGRLIKIFLDFVWLSALDHLLGALAGIVKALAMTLLLVYVSEIAPGVDLSPSLAYQVAALAWPYVQPLLLELAPEGAFLRRGIAG